MGSKYVPNIKGIKADQRYQQKTNPMPLFKNTKPSKSRGGKGKSKR